MPDQLPIGAQASPSAARNCGAILAVLQPRLPASGLVLEVAAGTGEHAIHFAASLPGLQWQPTDPDPLALASIQSWRNHAGLPNVLPPLQLDAASPGTWPVKSADAVVNINMIHIAPWAAAQGLMRGAGRLLLAGGRLFLYGPYLERDVKTAPSNLDFDHSLKQRNPAWGLRQLEDVYALARQHQLALAERLTMPANNLLVIFRKL